MDTYVITNLIVDGYERFVELKISEHKNIMVHFLEYDEYLNHSEISKKRKKGDVLSGDISIELVCNVVKVSNELQHYQKIDKSSHIEAVIDVVELLDDYSIYAKTSIVDENILVEFEKN